MKNVKVIFNDTDYELVKKACQQYDKLVKDYHEKILCSDCSLLLQFLAVFLYLYLQSAFQMPALLIGLS